MLKKYGKKFLKRRLHYLSLVAYFRISLHRLRHLGLIIFSEESFLKNFIKISLQPGESKEVSFTLTQKDLSFFKRDMTFGTEPGRFQVFVGGNSRDTKMVEFTLK